MTKSTLNIHGFHVDCFTNDLRISKDIIRPFSFFITDDKDHPSPVKIDIKLQDPPYDAFPHLTSSFSTPRNIVFQNDKTKIIDYFGKGVVVEDKANNHYTIYSLEKELLIESFYLLMLSLFGQYCDANGMLRIHSLGISDKNKAILLLLPSGSGKSTLAIKLLNESDVKLISDDSPIATMSGDILPFPLRIGTNDMNILKTIPEEYVYKLNRMEFGEKHFIDCSYWKYKIETKAVKTNVLFIGIRTLGGQPRIEKISKIKAFSALLRDAVIGVGIYQGLEFIVSHSPGEVLLKIPTLFKRVFIAIKLITISRSYTIFIPHNSKEVITLIKEFIKTL
jgi:hypothetical protein